MTIRITPIPTAEAARIRAGGPDANGQPAERVISDGVGTPCRHCLHDVPAGREMLVFAHRPFGTMQPYAEMGPVFLCADDCPRWEEAALPPVLGTSPDYLLRGYGADERIVYGTGGVIPSGRIVARAEELLADERVAFVHVRSARNNCFQCRIDPA